MRLKIFFSTLLLIVTVNARSLLYKQYNVGDGLIQSNVRGIAQLEDHEMVFLTSMGLSIFNGVEFYSPVNKEIQKYITTVALVDSALWIGTLNNGIFVWKDDRIIKHYGENSFLPGLRINKILQIDDAVYIATNNGILVIDKNGQRVYDKERGLASSIIISFHVDDQENIWVTFIQGFGVITADGKIINVADRKLFKNPFCNDVVVDRHGFTWVATRQGLLIFPRDELLQYGKLKKKKWFYAPGIKDDFINDMVIDKFGDIWLGTENGILKFEFSTLDKISLNKISYEHFVSYTLENYFVRTLFIDIEHNIWVGTRGGGVIKIQSDIFLTYDLQDGMLNREILAIYQTSDKNIWFGTNMGISRLRNNKIRNYIKKDGVPHNVVTCFYENENKELMVGTWNGLTVLRRGRFHPIRPPERIPLKILDIMQIDKRLYWLGTNRGLYQFDLYKRKFFKITKYPQLLGETITNIYKSEGEGRLYFVTYKDVYQLSSSGDSLISLRKFYNISTQSFSCVNYSRELGLLIGTSEGLYIADKDSVYMHLSEAKSLIDDWVISIVMENDRQFWIGSNKGVSLIAIDENNEIFSKEFSSKNGFIGEELITAKSMYKDKEGHIWFGTFLGASKYVKEKDILNTVPPVVKIKKLRIYQTEKKGDGLLQLKYDENTINIEYLGISFRDEKDVVYKYRLLGYQDEWSKSTHSREANYYNLPSGSYTFEVTACNRDGFWSETPVSTKLRILKPYWQTRTFISGLTFFIFFITYLIFRRRFIKVSSEKKKLEMKVQERTSTLIEQQKKLLKNNEELEKLTYDLRSSMKKLQNAQFHLVQSEKMASLGTLISGVTHELNNPVTFIYSNFNSLKEYLDSIIMVLNEVKKEYMNADLQRLFDDEDIDYIIEDLPQLLSGIEYGTNRIKDIVMQLYRFSHPGKNSQKVIVKENLQLTLDLFLNQYKRQITVYQDIEQLPMIEVPGGELNQVFLNVLVNAAHAIIKHKGEGNIWISAVADDEFIRVSIKDDGGGIPNNIKDKIFDLFYTTKPIGEGTGLGLSLSYTIMKNMGGDLILQDADDGAEFIIVIPIIATYNE